MKKLFRSILTTFTMLLCMACFAACGSPNITSIVISGVPDYLEAGQEVTLTATLTPSNASAGDVLWSSSNKSVATINNAGKVTAIATGQTVITAMSKKNSNVKDTVTLTVYGEEVLVILPNKTYAYDGTAKSVTATSAPDGLEIRYTYKNATYEESEFAPINAGTYTVTAYNRDTGVVLATSTMTISPKKAYLSIGNYTKTFNDPDPTFSATVTGLVNEDRITYNITRAAGENVNEYQITANITDRGNYDVIISPGKLTIKQLNVIIEADNKSSTYGENLVALTYTLKAENNALLDNTLKAQVLGGAPKMDTPSGVTRLPAGSYSITCDHMTSTNLNIISTRAGIYSVNKKVASISVAADQYKYAGAVDPSIIYAINGTLEGDDLSGCVSRLKGEEVGFYDYLLDQSINPNYSLIFNEGITTYRFEIKSNEVVIAFKNFEVDYAPEVAEGVIPSDCYRYDITINGTPIEYTIDATGKIYLNTTDNIVIGHTPNKELHLSDEEKTKYYQKWKVSMDKTAIGGYLDPHKYTFTFVDGYKFIKLIPLTVKADPIYKIYGDVDPTFTFSATGFLEGDDEESVLKEVELKRESGDNIGLYKITLKGDIELYDNKVYYKVIFEEDYLDVQKRELRIKPISYTGENAVYYGEPEKALTIDDSDLNIAARDTLSKVLGGRLSRVDSNDVGTYDITDEKLTLLSDNYYITYTKGSYQIIPRPIVITAVNKEIQYGEVVSQYQYSFDIVDEFQYYDEELEEYFTEIKPYTASNPTFTGAPALRTPGILYAGNTYDIVQGTLTCGNNFTIEYHKGTLTVLKREVSVSFTAQSFGFVEYEEQNPAPIFNITPELAYSDVCRITYYETTSAQGSNIISLLKNEESGQYIIEFVFTTGEGRILSDCYNVTINENFTELFYLGASLIDIAITAADGSNTVTKTYGDDYIIEDVFKITTTNTKYTLKLNSNVYNLKGLTALDTRITPNSYLIPAGTYTATVFNDAVRIMDESNIDVTANFAINITAYASLVVEKATLTCAIEPTVGDIVFGSARPVFSGGVYTFTNKHGDVITVNGTDAEYSTSDTSSYQVSDVAHSIMATYNPDTKDDVKKNFRPYAHSNILLTVNRAEIDTSVLEWKYGVTAQKQGVLEGNIYTVAADIEGANHITYNSEWTEENEFIVPTNVHNYRFLKNTLITDHLYTGVFFQDVGQETGFMYYIEDGEVKKVYPRNTTSFYAKINTLTGEIELYYTDGDKDYLLTNSATLAANGKPTYNNSIYSPTRGGIYVGRARLYSLNANYTVFEDYNPDTETETIDYHSLFMVKKINVNIYNFTKEIPYDNPLTFNYVTDPSEIYGKVIAYHERIGDGEYNTLGSAPVNVGEYAVTFIIDQANYYYYAEYIDFNIVPVTIEVIWGENDTFDFATASTPLTRQFEVKANGERVYATNSNLQIPEWLDISYSGVKKNGEAYGPTADIPCNAGDYTITISTVAAGGEINYIGTYTQTYIIAQRFYNGSIDIKPQVSIVYDVAYTKGKEGAIALYEKIASTMITNADFENYNIVLTYLGELIDPTGEDRKFVDLLNRAGGPYKIQMAISSKDGNIKETLKTGNLRVDKTNIPPIQSYSKLAVPIAYTGSNIYNELKTSDGSMTFTPQSEYFDSAKKTYEYRHNHDKDVYFGIKYTYYQVQSSSDTTGSSALAPKYPDETSNFIYMVIAEISSGANYYEPIQKTYYGYYYVVKTTVNMVASNSSVPYTGKVIDIPTVSVTNGELNPITIKYVNDDTIDGVFVERTIKKDGKTVTQIKGAGEYIVTFKITPDLNVFYENGSTFETSCTITVTPKKIENIDKFVEIPDPTYAITFAEGKTAMKINASKAYAENADYATKSGKLYIQLWITTNNDGSGTPIPSNQWKTLPAGIYYYYVAPVTGSASGNMGNYTQSDFVEFEIVRQVYSIELIPEAASGVTIHYTPSTSQVYSYQNVIVRKGAVSQTGFTQADFEVLYKTPEADDYTTVAPVINGTYDVKIRLFNNFYETKYIETTLTISAPTLDIGGTMSLTYGQAETTTSLTLIASGSNYEDKLIGSKDAQGKLIYTNETSKGYWFVFRQDFGVAQDNADLPAVYNVTIGGTSVDIMPTVRNLLGETKMSSPTMLNALDAGNNYIPIIYVSKDANFAISYSEFLISIAQFEITQDYITGVSGAFTPVIPGGGLTPAADFTLPDGGLVIRPTVTFKQEGGTTYFSKTTSYTATSIYNSAAVTATGETAWEFEPISITNDTTEFNATLALPTGDPRNPLPSSLKFIASASDTISKTAIDNYFNSSDDNIKGVAVLISAILTLDNNNYILGDNIVFNLSVTFNKTTTTEFAQKEENGQIVEHIYSYGQTYLDEYWGNLVEGESDLTNYPDALQQSTENNVHFYLYNLIEMPFAEISDISLFRGAWKRTLTSKPWREHYTIEVFNYDASATNGVGSTQYTPNATFYTLKGHDDEIIKDHDERDTDIIKYYKYDIDKYTPAGQYVLKITLKESDFFSSTVLYARVRLKPKTYYVKTDTGSMDKVILQDATQDPVRLYDQIKSESGLISYSELKANYTVEYIFEGATSYKANVVYSDGNYSTTPVTSGVEFSTFEDMVKNGGTRQYTVKVTPADTNSIYVEDISVLVIGGSIELGNYNIYDALDLEALADKDNPSYNSQIETLAGIGTLAWAPMLQQTFDKTGNSLTEDAISIMRFLDANSVIQGNVDTATWEATAEENRIYVETISPKTYYRINIKPNANNQIVFDDLTISITLEDFTNIVITASISINLKLITKTNETTYTYNGNPQAPDTTAYFQGWVYHMLKTAAGAPDTSDYKIKENNTSIYSELPDSLEYRNIATGAVTTTKPTSAGSYEIISKYTVNFVGGNAPVTFNCVNNFTISKAKATITMDSQEFVYDKTSKSLTYTTSIAGLNVKMTYYTSKNAVEANPRNADVYRVVAVIDDVNYYGATEATLTIKRTAVRIEVTMPTEYTYTGAIIKPTRKVYNDDNIDITDSVTIVETYNGSSDISPINAGSYTYVITVGDAADANVLVASVTKNYTILRATPEIDFIDPDSFAYTGYAIAPTVTISPASCNNSTYFTITYNGSKDAPTEAGLYRVYAKYAPPTNDNYMPVEKSYTYEILPKALNVTYDGSPSSEVINLTYTSSMTATLIRANADVAANVTYKYEGYEYNADGTLSTTKYSSNTFPVNAGVYSIIATPQSSNYTGRVTTTMIIDRAKPSISFSYTSLTYSGLKSGPSIVASPNTLTYTTTYSGSDFAGVSYTSTDAPINAGLYKVTTSFAGNKNYYPASATQAFEISKIQTATLEFDNDSLIKVFTIDTAQKPTVKVLVNEVLNTSLADDVVITFGGNIEAPINAGSYKVEATLVSCNYAATPISAVFTISKKADYTLTLINGGNLALGATAAANIGITTETPLIIYSGKTYLDDGSLPAEDNYINDTLPANAGTYTGTIIADNYAEKTFSFNILKTDLSSQMTLADMQTTLGVGLDFNTTMTIGGTAYKVKYLFKTASEAEYKEIVPNTLGTYMMKVVVCNQNYSGEKEATFTVTYPEAATSKVVIDSPFYMYTGNNINVDAKLYLNGVLQTNPVKTYKKDGSIVSNVVDTGDYTVSLGMSGSAQVFEASFTVVPQMTLSVPSGADAVFNNVDKAVAYSFVTSSDEALHKTHTSLRILRNGYFVPSVRNAGNYEISVCYDGYPVLTKNITIAKMIITNLTAPNLSIEYGDVSEIPTILGTYKVRHEINFNGNTSYKETLPIVGDHKIKYIIDEENYQGEAIANLNVYKKTIILNIDDIVTEYTGEAIKLPESYASLGSLAYSYSTTPSNYSPTNLPINVGEYYITASSASSNYAVSYKDNSRPYIKLTITKATPTFYVTNLSQVYDGTVKSPTAVAHFNGRAYMTQISNTNMINAGAYNITFSMMENTTNFNSSASYEFVITKAEVDINYTLPSDLVYNGTQKEITATASVAEVGSVSQKLEKDSVITTAVDAGMYKLTLSTAESANYNAKEVVVVFNILPARTTVSCIVEDQNYTGSAKPVIVTTNPTATTKTITYSNSGNTTPPTNAGTYTATIVVTPEDSNYSTETVVFSYTIIKVVDTITYSGAEGGYFYYDGTVKNLTNIETASGSFETQYYKFNENGYKGVQANTVIEEGDYKVEIKTNGGTNHYGTTKTVFFTICRQQLTASISGRTYIYDGTPKTVDLVETHGLGSGKVKLHYKGNSYTAAGACTTAYDSDTAPSLPGIYVVTLSPTDSKYIIAGETSAYLIIDRVFADVSISILDGATPIGDDVIVLDYIKRQYTVKAKAITTIGGVTEEKDVSSSAKITLLGFTDATTLEEGGVYEITVNLNKNLYYGYGQRLITIKPMEAVIFAKQTVLEYTGASNSLKYLVVDSNGEDITEEVKDSITITYSTTAGVDLGGAPTDIGTYVAHITLANASYIADATYSYSIVKTQPDLLYTKEEDDKVYLYTDASTSLDVFKLENYTVLLNGIEFNNAEYTATFYKQAIVDGEDGEIIIEWNKVTNITDQTISERGTYKLTISIDTPDKIAKYKDCLSGYNEITDDDGNITALTWDFRFSVTGA